MPPEIDVRRSGDRMRTRTDWLDSRHSFSFGPHYDPSNTHFGLLLVNNEHRVAAGAGFEPHPHRDCEIVTWVLSGRLAHHDSDGHRGVLTPGIVQRMSAGRGLRHSERNDDAHDDLHMVQMEVLPAVGGREPGYDQRDVSAELASGAPVVVASGMPRHAADRAVTIAQPDAALHAVRLAPDGRAALPDAPLAHLFVPRGAVDLEGAGALGTGDSARVTGSDGQRVTAGPDGAEILIWEMHTALG